MRSLADVLEDSGRMSFADALGWTYRLAAGVKEFHRFGVTHGSVSPLCVKAAGASCKLPGGLVDPREVATLPAYHSLARLDGGGLSSADDCWAIVATFFCLLTGRPPFPGMTAADVKTRILKSKSLSLSKYATGRPELTVFIKRHLSSSGKSPDGGIKALLDELLKLADDGVELKALSALEQIDGLEEDDPAGEARTVLRTLDNLQAEAELLGESGVLSEVFAKLKPGARGASSSKKPQAKEAKGATGAASSRPGKQKRAGSATTLNRARKSSPKGMKPAPFEDPDEVTVEHKVVAAVGADSAKAVAEELGASGTVVMKIDASTMDQAKALREQALNEKSADRDKSPVSETVSADAGEELGPAGDATAKREEQSAQVPSDDADVEEEMEQAALAPEASDDGDDDLEEIVVAGGRRPQSSSDMDAPWQHEVQKRPSSKAIFLGLLMALALALVLTILTRH